MYKGKFNESQRLAILAEQDAGKNVEEICRHYQISPATFYKWKKDLADQQNDDRRRVKQLELENARLKKMYAELRIDHEILQEGYETAGAR
jgi:putative transposase